MPTDPPPPRNWHFTRWLIVFGLVAMSGCSTVEMHLAPSDYRPDSIRGVYRGTKLLRWVACVGVSTKNPKARAYFAALSPLYACDFVLSAVADTVFLPYDAIAKDDPKCVAQPSKIRRPAPINRQ